MGMGGQHAPHNQAMPECRMYFTNYQTQLMNAAPPPPPPPFHGTNAVFQRKCRRMYTCMMKPCNDPLPPLHLLLLVS